MSIIRKYGFIKKNGTAGTGKTGRKEKNRLFYGIGIFLFLCILTVAVLSILPALRYAGTENGTLNPEPDKSGARQTGNDKYTLSFIKDHAEITVKDKYLFIEDRDKSTETAGNTVYIELKNKGQDYSMAYNIAGYELGLFYKDDSYRGYAVLADSSAYYEITDKPEDFIMTRDRDMIEDIMDIDYESARITDIYRTGDAAVKDYNIEEDVVILSDASYGYALYLNPVTGICKRLQAVRYEDSYPVEEFLVTIEESGSIMIPEEVTEFEQQETLTGEEFAGVTDKFLLSALSIMISGPNGAR